MNDIRLKHTTDPYKWDWSFTWNDVEVVRGNTQLINAVKHAVLLKPNELIQETYQQKGCQAHNHIYNPNTNQTQIGSQIETAAKSVEGVHDAKAKIEITDSYETKTQIELLTTSMEEVTLNEL